MTPSIDDVVNRVSRAAFGRPLVTNVLRGQVVEAIIALALEPEWTWCASDYASWDFERADGRRLEVKQRAALQSWAASAHGIIRPSFDIKERTMRWEGARQIHEAGRFAHLYVFAFHPRLDDDADHRDPFQWEFYPIRTVDLPLTQRIGLSRVRSLAPASTFADLKGNVASTAAACAYDQQIPSPRT